MPFAIVNKSEKFIDLNLKFLPEPGDIVFSQIPDQILSRAICASSLPDITLPDSLPCFSHVGIITNVSSPIDSKQQTLYKAQIVEAFEQVSKSVTLKQFTMRSQNTHFGIIKPNLSSKIRTAAANHAESMTGIDYNYSFDWNFDKLYCAQLVALAYIKAGAPTVLFEPKPMYFGSSNFNNAHIRNIQKTWQNYFKSLNIPVPSGKPGLNPLLLWHRLTNLENMQ